jgi:hypothetical protein
MSTPAGGRPARRPVTLLALGVRMLPVAGSVGSAVNDAARLAGSTLGVAVIGSVAASLYGSRLAATLPPGLPARAVTAARGSVGGAVIAAHQAGRAGLAGLARRLDDAATIAFLHSFAAGCLVAGGVAAAGAIVAAFLLPARPSPPEAMPRAPEAADAASTAAC